jgi:hypothetical protein
MCVIWSLKIRGEHRLRVFEGRVLRRIFGLKREGGRSGRLEELHNLHASPCFIGVFKSRLRCAGHVVRMQNSGRKTRET